ncbi:sulfotransferase [Rhodosalinus sp. 5P4]|uniref:sulfotransferase family protein n=1 Tax=Rhodosalinus sp. 5P4 TaxID=3239196 RepID=UPI003525F469
MSLPDFLIIGAMKCGTSTLQAQLAHQKGVFMSTPKEPNYFSDDQIYARGRSWYEALFADAAPGDLKGEASTHYTKLPTYPQTLPRMRAMLDAPRLVYMIRNPMVRAVSHYIHEWTEGRVGSDAREAFHATPEIAAYGFYGMQIAPFAEAYGPDRILLTSLEQISADPEAAFAEIRDFLGLPYGAAWVHDMPAQNVSAARMRRLPMQGLLIDNPVATSMRRALVPKALRNWVRARRTMTTRPDIPDDLQDRLKAEFLADRARLAELFPGHPALELCYPFAPS